MTKSETPKYFVATTALDAFWDTSYPVVFLGEWAKRYCRRAYWESFENTTLQAPIQEKQIFETIEYLQKVYDQLLPLLAKTLNEIHQVNFSVRYWRIVIGPWLLYYLHVVHDKYSQIQSLKKQYPNFTSITLDQSCFVVPQNTLEYANLMKGDIYNLQLYSQLFELCGYKFPTRTMEVKVDPDLDMGFFVKSRKSLAWQVADFVNKASFGRKRIIFESVYFQKPILLKLMKEMKGRLLPFVADGQSALDMPTNPEWRGKIGSLPFGGNEFEKILLPMISKGLPKSMLEGFSKTRAQVSKKSKNPPTAIMSAVGWYYNEDFKMFAAECAERGSTLLGVQHGGSYGMLEYMLQEKYELSITDKYFSWGWTKNNSQAKIKPVSATKLIKEAQDTSAKKSKDILYITDGYSRFRTSYPMSADFWKDYLTKQAAFLSHLTDRVKVRLIMRPHREDGGMDFKERFRDIIPDVEIEKWETPFNNRDYGLLVCDHPWSSTTFIESFINNRPTILFTSPGFAANSINQVAKPYWDKLKDVGILYYDPLEAAKKVDEIYDNVEEWWNQPDRQQAIKSFLSAFGQVSDHWDKEWVTVLESVLKEKQ